MIEKKDDVVNLLMWEVGKSREDSEKEFDRTVQYIGDTIGALKDLDRVSSRFAIEQGKNLIHPTHPPAATSRYNNHPYPLLVTHFSL